MGHPCRTNQRMPLWGQVLHWSATTTEAIRRVIRHNQANLRTLSKRYGINPKTVAKVGRSGAWPSYQGEVGLNLMTPTSFSIAIWVPNGSESF